MPRRVPAAYEGIRLFDRVRSVYPAIPVVPVIIADDIQRDIDAIPGNITYPASWYGPIAPPFRHFFVESSVHVEFTGARVFAQRGVFITDVSPVMRADPSRAGYDLPAGWHYCLQVQGYMYTPALGLRAHRDVCAMLHLDDAGQWLDDAERVTVQVTWRPGLSDQDAALQGWSVTESLPTALKAVSALHQRCVVDLVQPGGQARRRARVHAGIETLHDYYVLRVAPITPQRADEFRQIGSPAQVGSRDHVVRGHFRIYTEARPLFGKYVRTVWVAEHRRGDDSYGTIRKDYEV